ncbi:MAG: beta-ketoacyl-ACP synthase II [Halanaerobiales bacterium]|nr:beta-ketoacyl-ACP synthase II [Halanaerobiales bacterium]
MKNRVVITGMGVVSPIGIGIEDFLQALFDGKKGISKIERFNPDKLSSKIAGEVKNFSFRNYIPLKKARKMDRSTRMGLVAAKQAINDSGIELSEEEKYRTGIIVATTLGALPKSLKLYEKVKEKGPKRAAPHFIHSPLDACAGYLAVDVGIKGINLTTASGCASSVNALGLGLMLIRTGFVDRLIVTGTEMPIAESVMAPFCNSKVLSTRNNEPTKASRPFDKDSDGFVFGEGAGAVVLENLELAIKRNARIYSEIAGYGTTCDAYSMSSIPPTSVGLEKAMELALKDAQVSLSEVDYINAYANSLYHYDLLETRAIKNIFSDRAYKLHISSTKSMIGHLLGASGIVETIATSLAVYKDFIPPTVNLDEPRTECDLNYVPNKAIRKKINVSLKNSIANANINSTLIIKKYY